MGRLKEQLLKKEEEDWVDEMIDDIIDRQNNLIYNNLFEMDDLQDFYMIELQLVNGQTYGIYSNNLKEVTNINIKWTEPVTLHKGDDVKQVTALISVPIAHIACMAVYYE